MLVQTSLRPRTRNKVRIANLPVGLGAVVNRTWVVSGNFSSRASVALPLFVCDVESDSEGVLVGPFVALAEVGGEWRVGYLLLVD